MYRKDILPNVLNGAVSKFISTSVTQKGVLGGKPNVAIIIPKNINGAYIEPLAVEQFKKQREFLLADGVKVKKIDNIGGVAYYVAEE